MDSNITGNNVEISHSNHSVLSSDYNCVPVWDVHLPSEAT